jgi:site-specific DNA-methyltransferase (adenine-specific)
LLIPKAPIAGQTDFSKPIRFYHNKNAFIAKPGEICTESWIVAGAFDSEAEVLAYKSYIFTKIVRFLILQTVISQDVNKKNYIFVPELEKYEGVYTDIELCKKWNITNEEWEYIDSRILETGIEDE